MRLFPESSEVTVPSAARWWNDRVREFIEARRANDEVSESYLRTTRQALEVFPRIARRAGAPKAPGSPAGVTREHVRLVKGMAQLAPSTRGMYLIAARSFLRWAGNDLAEDRQLWRFSKSGAVRRRWLTIEQLAALFSASRGRERLLVALMGYAGLRRCEVLRLRVRDVELGLPAPVLRVLGKGTHGGKWRTVPAGPTVFSVLLPEVSGAPGMQRIYDHHPRTADNDLMAAARRAGLPVRVSGHDLRRSFGRIAYYAGVDLVTLRNIYGHVSVDMTAHYIGLDETQMFAGVARFDQAMQAALPKGECR